MLDDAQIDALRLAIDRRCGLQALWVYGSQASGRARADSDVDLAVLVERPPVAEVYLELLTELATITRRDVDLVLLDRVSPILAMQVLRQGRLLVDADPVRRGLVEARLFSQYADLKRTRALAERALIARMSR